MKSIKNFMTSFILRSDMFSAQSSLRFNGQSSYETCCGGFVSILLVIGFGVIFGSSFIDVLYKVNITATYNYEDNPYDTNEINQILFAVGIKGLDFTDTQRYFNIILKQKNVARKGSTVQNQISLSPCQLQNWKDLGTNFQKLFSVYQMQKMLCPTLQQNLTLKGFGGSAQWTTLYVLVQQCRNKTNDTSIDWTCHTPADIQNKFSQQFSREDFFKVEFLILNTIISPEKQNSTSTVIENEIFVTFSNTSGSRSEIKLARYLVTTDNSIWPISDQSTQEGYYLSAQNTYTINLYSTHYVRIQIQKSRTIYQITREHQKLDETFSYVGGLFSILFGFLFFFFSSYNEYKYEIAVAEHTFSLDGTGRKIKQEEFGFWTYLKYALYDWIKTFGICIKWKRMQEIDAARQEATEQMDIRYLMKKIQRYQILHKFLIGEVNVIFSNLSRPPTLEQVKRMRKIVQYYDKVIRMENQQNLLQNVLRVSVKNEDRISIENTLNMNNSTNLDNQQLGKNAEESELESEDQQIQRQIAKIYQKECQKTQKNSLTNDILNNIPQSMKDRLLNISCDEMKSKCNADNENENEKYRMKVESVASLNDQSSKPFVISLFGRKEN